MSPSFCSTADFNLYQAPNRSQSHYEKKTRENRVPDCLIAPQAAHHVAHRPFLIMISESTASENAHYWPDKPIMHTAKLPNIPYLRAAKIVINSRRQPEETA
jgi:hypothetical protein